MELCWGRGERPRLGENIGNLSKLIKRCHNQADKGLRKACPTEARLQARLG